VEQNYNIHNTEMLAIIRGLEEWRHYLEGTWHPVEIWTDHKNLEYFRVAQKLNHRQARWSLYLSRFDFTLHHKPGQSMGKPDALSRQANHRLGQGDNDNLTLLAPELFQIHVLAGVRLKGNERNILQEVWCSLKDNIQEESVAKAARELWKDKGRGTIKSTEWSKSDGLLIFHGKIYVPNDRDLRRHIIEQHHDMRIARHAGHFKTLEFISRNYWWPQMSHYNNSKHSLTQQTPFMLDTRRNPHMGFEPQQPRSNLELVNEFVECMTLGIEEAKAALTKAKDEYAMYYNRRHEPALVFALGDKVWLDGSYITTNQPSSKLSHQCLGPFVVEACVGHGAYRLALPPHFCRLHPVFPVVKLSPTPPDPIPG
jgi:hypothetical protein